MTAVADTSWDADVIVVGGGPVGLSTAFALAHHGVQVRLLEQRRQVLPHSRANNLWARPQELLHAIGLRNALAAQAYRIREVNTLVLGEPVDPVRIADVDSPFPEVLYSGQDVIETTLAEQLQARGVTVERGRRLVGFEQDDDGVTLTVAEVDPDDEQRTVGQPQTLHCRYLVAADGGDSLVRRQLGLDFEPERLPHVMNRQVDAKLSWRRATDFDKLWFFYYRKGFCGVLPVWGGHHRLFFLADDEGVPERDPTLEEMQALAREVTGDETLTLTDPVWLTHSRFQHGVAAHYAQGRVLLAGDAGHRNLPNGGQGMNAGLHDAVAAAWRLAMVLQGRAQPVVLDSYDAERGGEHRALDARQRRGFHNSVYRGRLSDAAMSLAAKAVPTISTLIQGTDDWQQLAVAYPESPLSEDRLTNGLRQLVGSDAVRAGARAPDAPVIAADGGSTRLFDHLYNPDGWTCGWALLAFDGRDDTALPVLQQACRAVQSWPWVRPRLVLSAATPAGDEAAVLLNDLDGVAHAAYGLAGQPPALVLVRPDGHIAFRAPAAEPASLLAYCTRVFKTGGGSAG
ncbi:FAD-dependent oxidoreductase [Aquincola sp. J276]|uniref:FAD-dependent oxidoreductase n=1 Tax=Aquincola sp. J276 TaxID=2898432 RepID=UPI002151FA89|nr:FAD-dependent oxidoreductase [Aquincola sp. J276]MCR5864497.1 FAD-dependent oxidoreductase [Aquincola sp. J276]